MNLNGNASRLRQIAKKVTLCDGALDVWFLPYRPNIQGVIYRQLEEALPPEWKNNFVLFAHLDSTIIDVEIADGSDNMDAVAMATYWDVKGNIPIDNYLLFEQLISSQMLDTLWSSYEDTRAKLPPAPKETQEGKPAIDSPKGKAGKKRTKAIS